MKSARLTKVRAGMEMSYGFQRCSNDPSFDDPAMTALPPVRCTGAAFFPGSAGACWRRAFGGGGLLD